MARNLPFEAFAFPLFANPQGQPNLEHEVLLLNARAQELDRIVAKIQNDLPFRIQRFQLDVDQDGLVLQGTTRSYYEKQLVQEAVLRASSLPIAANDIAVSADGLRR